MSSHRVVHLCPLSPSFHSDPLAEDEGWDELNDADVMVDMQTVSPGDQAPEEEVDIDDLSVVQVPVGMPAPHQPSQKEIDVHNLTHAKYKAWCPHCVFGRKPNAQHRKQTGNLRKVPMFCADYCYVRDERDEDLLMHGRQVVPKQSPFCICL